MSIPVPKKPQLPIKEQWRRGYLRWHLFVPGAVGIGFFSEPENIPLAILMFCAVSLPLLVLSAIQFQRYSSFGKALHEGDESAWLDSLTDEQREARRIGNAIADLEGRINCIKQEMKEADIGRYEELKLEMAERKRSIATLTQALRELEAEAGA